MFAAYSCSMEICLDLNGDKKLRYLDYFVHRINLLRHYKITPVVVFDGASIPCKAATEHERQRSPSFIHPSLFYRDFIYDISELHFFIDYPFGFLGWEFEICLWVFLSACLGEENLIVHWPWKSLRKGMLMLLVSSSRYGNFTFWMFCPLVFYFWSWIWLLYLFLSKFY